MNNPIGRMPNPMMVPPISPIGNAGPQQPPSAMPLPVVNQPKVDMQTMGTTASQRKKFNDLLESLSAPRQKSEDLPNVQGLHYGGMAGGFGMPMMPMMNPYMGMGMGMGMGGMGMNPYSMAYPSYSPGFGTTPTAPTTPTDTSQNPFGSTLTPRQEPVPTYGNMDSGTFPDASGNAMINNPSVGEPPAMDAPVDPSDMPMFQPIDFNKQPMTPPSKYGVYGPDQLGAFVEDMIKKGNLSNSSNFGFGNVDDRPVAMPQPIDLKDYGVMQPTVMNNVQPFQGLQGYERGGDVQYLKGGGPTMPSGKYSYSKDLDEKIAKLIGGAITTPEEERFKSPPMMGMAERPAMYMAAPVNPYNKNIGYNVEQGLPKNDPLLTQGQNVKVGMRSGQNVLPNDPVQDTSFMAGQRGKLDEMRAKNRSPDYYDALRGRMYNQKPPILDVPILPMQSGPDIGPIMPARDLSTGIESITQSQSIPDVLKDLGEYIIDKIGIGSFANGGEVQYLRGGGPTKPRIKRFDTSTNEDTTIPDTASKIGNFLSNLFSGGKDNKPSFSPAGPTNLLPQAIDRPSSMERQRERNLDRISNVGGSIGDAISNLTNMATGSNMQKFADDFVGTQEGINKAQSQILPNVISSLARAGSGGNFASAQPEGGLKGSAFDYVPDPFQVSNYFSGSPNLADASSIDSVATIDKSGGDNLGLGTINTMETIEDALNNISSPRRGGAGNVVKDVAPPVSPLNIGQYDIVQGMNEADKAFPAPISDPYNIGKMGEFDSSPSLGSIQDPSQIPFKTLDDVTSAVQNQEPLGSGMQSGQTPFEVGGGDISGFSTLTPPARPENISQIAENIAAQSGQTNQQGFGIGQLLPLIVGMFNPTAGMALGIMQAMGGKGEGEGEGLLGNLAKTLGIGDTERTFGDYTFRSLEDPRSGESAGMTPEERRELFLKNQASNERDRAGREMQENIDAITKPTVPDPVLGEDGSYSCPLPYVYDPNTKMCVMMEAGLGGQGAAANETEAPAGMQMGGQVSPSLNNAVDNFLQALA